MNDLTAYLFGDPANGSKLILLSLFFAVCWLIGLGAWVAVSRLRLLAHRRRARTLRSIMLWSAIPGALYLQARYFDVPFLQLRFWFVLIGLIWLARLIPWAISLKRMESEIVDEREKTRKQAYFKRAAAGQRKPKPKRRR